MTGLERFIFYFILFYLLYVCVCIGRRQSVRIWVGEGPLFKHADDNLSATISNAFIWYGALLLLRRRATRERERERERSVRVCICSPAFVCVILSRWAFELFRRRGIPQLRLSGSSIVAHAMTISREKESFCPAHTHTVDLVVGRGYRMSLSSLLQVQKYPSAARALAPIPNLCSTVTLNWWWMDDTHTT
jgi:hypothetical protein